ncbi:MULTISPECIES: TRAP transporter small permease [Neorhizobium]|uniref:TRAP transporter small permease n=1 Tax=Neorhizobium TaxID=1525371 RepID=UPI000CF9273C|nr:MULTISPECIES: TRAP transporter small permease [Neorhizobium]
MKSDRAMIYRLCGASNDIGAFAIGVIFFITTCELVSRYFLGHPLVWVPDYSSYLLCVVVFFAIPELTAKGSHISIRVVLDLVGEERAANFARIVEGIAAVTCIIVAYLCWMIMKRQYASGTETLAAAPIPKWIILAVMFYGLSLSGGLHAWRSITNQKTQQAIEG